MLFRMKRSAGILLFRRLNGETEVMLVHPGGPLWARKDEGAWSVPKGEIGEQEEPEAAARREFFEETGIEICADLVPLTPVRQKSGKLVMVWAAEQDVDPSLVKSNLFEMEWPPRSGRKQSFPEADRAAWFSPAEARKNLIPAQAALIDELEQLLKKIH